MPGALRVDCGAATFLAVCSLCGWRSLHLDRAAAWRAAADHERGHPGQYDTGRYVSRFDRPDRTR